jgi:hypothetical protein
MRAASSAKPEPSAPVSCIWLLCRTGIATGYAALYTFDTVSIKLESTAARLTRDFTSYSYTLFFPSSQCNPIVIFKFKLEAKIVEVSARRDGWTPPSCFFQAPVRRCACRSNNTSVATRWRSSISAMVCCCCRSTIPGRCWRLACRPLIRDLCSAVTSPSSRGAMRSIHDPQICPGAWPACVELATRYFLSRIVKASRASGAQPRNSWRTSPQTLSTPSNPCQSSSSTNLSSPAIACR